MSYPVCVSSGGRRARSYAPKKPVPDAITIQEIEELGSRILRPEIRCLYYVLYLSGARLTEALNLRVKDIEYEFDKQGRKVILFKLITLKHRKKPLRIVPAVLEDKKQSNKHLTLYRELENEMAEYIQEHTSDMLMDENIFRISSSVAQKQFKKRLSTVVSARYGKKIIRDLDFKLHPHYLRHCRITHWVVYYNLPAVTIQYLAGWSSMKPLNIYLHLKYKDVLEVM